MMKSAPIPALLFAIVTLVACSAEDADKVENDPPASSEPTPPEPLAAPKMDPLAIEGTPPQFPLKAESFGEIDDRVRALKDDDAELVEYVDFMPLIDTVIALRASSQEHLEKSIDRSITYRKMMLEAEKYRGFVTEARGAFQFETKVDIPDNKSKITRMYRGYIRNGSGEVTSYLSLSPAPRSNEELNGKPVRIAGIFLKRYTYKSGQVGEKVYWTPLLFIRQMELLPEEPASAGTWKRMEIILTIMIAGGLFFLFYARMRERAGRMNYFTQVKRDRGEKPTIFPRPKPPRATRPPSRPKKPAEGNPQPPPA